MDSFIPNHCGTVFKESLYTSYIPTVYLKSIVKLVEIKNMGAGVV